MDLPPLFLHPFARTQRLALVPASPPDQPESRALARKRPSFAEARDAALTLRLYGASVGEPTEDREMDTVAELWGVIDLIIRARAQTQNPLVHRRLLEAEIKSLDLVVALARAADLRRRENPA